MKIYFAGGEGGERHYTKVGMLRRLISFARKGMADQVLRERGKPSGKPRRKPPKGSKSK